ncbi:MAG: hypothetical protein US50_C0001G0010 [Candidatus Nomurabacteria bacterium GW2011_GWB1_37_5]|uniref:Uncharacterized protein n=1 Tax=Candidatus Nomurabacteria bacterium GW2011_GWB1_37_5 TaxID=1618742 RepID=A0A0G0GYE4_9BACT|nr:MAG: hypothetical protein US50_C0001G0010 [Candidatus Nomurabacteria bacterium GW2011_GWB1_37_5]
MFRPTGSKHWIWVDEIRYMVYYDNDVCSKYIYMGKEIKLDVDGEYMTEAGDKVSIFEKTLNNMFLGTIISSAPEKTVPTNEGEGGIEETEGSERVYEWFEDGTYVNCDDSSMNIVSTVNSQVK